MPGQYTPFMVDDYRTGDDFTLEYVGLRFAFSRADFVERIAQAAHRLALADQAAFDDPDAADDLATLIVRGSLPTPRTTLGRHLASVADPLLVYWLRKLVFRGTWIDARVRRGDVDVVFDDHSGRFGYRRDGHSVPVSVDADVPSFAAVAFRAS